jgi:hypothetical protein
MRGAFISMAVVQALLGFGATAEAQHCEPAMPPGKVYGVGCHWFGGHRYCSRYCYLEVDGYYYLPTATERCRLAGRPLVIVDPPPSRHARPTGPRAWRRYDPPAGSPRAPRP